jgi:TonB-linked SusC/RagA family outer membrane protein
MVKIFTNIFCTSLLIIIGVSVVNAKSYTIAGSVAINKKSTLLYVDTIAKDTTGADTLGKKIRSAKSFQANRDSLNILSAKNVPNLSVQQMLKGNIAGLYVQEISGEPGSQQSMILQGLSGPVFNNKDIYNLQPTVYLNGIPLVQDNPFAYDVQKYDYNRIGPATNLLSSIDVDNIESIRVIKDPADLAKLGPNAANGAVWITTKAAKSGIRDISINSYFGMVQANNPTTVNGVFENNFRKPFYQKYATADNYANYAAYLKDSTNTDYFGKSNWSDLYYKTVPLYSVDLAITGGSDRANFRFFGSGTKNAGNADATDINRYNAAFAINMAPFNWLTVSSFVTTTRLDRDRNRSLRDRFAETRFLPDFVNPLSPNKDNYQSFLNEYDKAVDLNRSNLVQGSFSLNFKVGKLNFIPSLLFDYNEGVRDAFFPSTLMEGINYVSNYFGFNQRFVFKNVLTYSYDLHKDHHFNFEAGESIQNDTYKYNYARAYNGPNDFIKINQVEGSKDSSDYLGATNFYVFRYADREKNALMSFYGSVKYSYKDLLNINATVRRDGSSNGQPDSRWITSPAVSVKWNLKNQFLKQGNFFDDLSVGASWGRLARIFADDRFAAGPQYRVEYGWNQEPTIPTYGGSIGISRPYNTGWVGYNISLPYSDRSAFNIESSIFKGRLNASVTLYNREDKNQLLNLPVAQESGYASIYKSGMWVNNKGAELILNGLVLNNSKGLTWHTGINVNYNRNILKALPDNLNQLVINGNKLVVGNAVDQYWLYTNQGIYNTDAEVPVNPATNKKLTFNGIPLKAGDPKWVDYNGDYNITEADKVLTGHRSPAFTGGWSNDFKYKAFDLNFNFFFAVGQKAINEFDAARYDFVNRESANDITSIKEITSWQTNSNIKSYPLYNVWSNVIPYRQDQDLFLEGASYVKLRSVTLGYDVAKGHLLKNSKAGFNRFYVYITASNLLTLTKFSGTDPELINYDGTYDGTSLPIPKTFIVGFKINL